MQRAAEILDPDDVNWLLAAANDRRHPKFAGGGVERTKDPAVANDQSGPNDQIAIGIEQLLDTQLIASIGRGRPVPCGNGRKKYDFFHAVRTRSAEQSAAPVNVGRLRVFGGGAIRFDGAMNEHVDAVEVEIAR